MTQNTHLARFLLGAVLSVAPAGRAVARASDGSSPPAGSVTPETKAGPSSPEAPTQLSPAPSSVPLQSPSPIEERKWYAGQMGVFYGTSLALTLSPPIVGKHVALIAAGTIGLVLGPPALHLWHENGSMAAASMGLRVLFIATYVGAAGDCFSIYGPPRDAAECDVLAVGLLAELIAMPVLDLVFARQIVERPGAGLSLVALPPYGSHSGVIGLAGRF